MNRREPSVALESNGAARTCFAADRQTSLVSLSVEQDGPALTLRVRARDRETNAAVAVSIER